MSATIRQLLRFLGDDDGVTCVQYAMLVFLLVLVVLTGLTWLGQATAVCCDAPIR